MRLPITKILLPLALLVAALAGCDSTPKVSDDNVEHVSYTKLTEMLDKATEKKPLVLVDVRPEPKYAKEHISGAISIPLPQLQPGDKRLRGADIIVVYGESWDDGLTDSAAKKLLLDGYEDVYSFKGGLLEWNKQKKLERGETGKKKP